MTQSWSPEGYSRHAGFVPELGADILDWLAPRAGERILDLGCGDGTLTLRIIGTGARVVGLDSSPEMVQAARARGVEAVAGSGEQIAYEAEFDAVFSNAAVHWMTEPKAVAAGVARALKPGGRFVAELGGHGNVAAIATALRAAAGRFGGDPALARPWYFPTRDEYAAVLVDAGLNVVRARLAPRPTPLPTGVEGWLETFARVFLDQFAGERRREAVDYVVGLLAPALRDSAGEWTADYVRLRIEARKPG